MVTKYEKTYKKLERIQRSATKLLPSLKDLSYEERLSKLDLQTLEQQREREGERRPDCSVQADEQTGKSGSTRFNNKGSKRSKSALKKNKKRKVTCRRDIRKNSGDME